MTHFRGELQVFFRDTGELEQVAPGDTGLFGSVRRIFG